MSTKSLATFAFFSLALLGSAPGFAGSYIGGDMIANVEIKNSTVVLVGGATVSSSGVKVDGELVIGNSIRNTEVHGDVIANVEITNSTFVAAGFGRIVLGNAAD